MTYKLLIVLSVYFYSTTSYSQVLTGVQTKWDNDFREWTLYAIDIESEQEIEGEIKIRWLYNNDWTEWEFSLGDLSGNIRLKWKDNPNVWQIASDGHLFIAKSVWRDDFSQWRIESGDMRLTLLSKWKNNPNEWLLREKDFGSFEIETEWENDPRDWIIYDDLNTVISLPEKIALVFLSIFHSSPR